jgi:hypothetical protein
MENNNNKEKNKVLSQADVRQRISLLSGHKMSEKLFNKKADKMAKIMYETMGLETINKMKYYAPLSGEFWQFQYVA